MGWLVGLAYEKQWYIGLGGKHVCVLHVKPFFLPVDIQHKQCPCRFFNPVIYNREMQVMWSPNYATAEVLRYYVVLQ